MKASLENFICITYSIKFGFFPKMEGFHLTKLIPYDINANALVQFSVYLFISLHFYNYIKATLN